MRKQLFGSVLAIALSLSAVPEAAAIQSAPIEENANVAWSQVISDPFDGIVVYDRHQTREFVFVSSWSKQGIRATYFKRDSVFAGYETTWRSRWFSYDDCFGRRRGCNGRHRHEDYPLQQPVYREVRTNLAPRRILFAVSGERYTYEQGTVNAKLAAALANAPDGNMRIRLEWDNGKTQDVEIGQGTVKAWKTVFKS